MKQNVVAILPAYNARRTLSRFVRSLPRGVFDEILLVDDCSADGTYDYAKMLRGIKAYQTPRNLGYGGNLKYCLTLALDHGADVIIELHPDGEYGVDGIPPALAEVQKGAQFILGNRFSSRSVKLPQGMIPAKYLVTRLLSALYDAALGVRIPDMHQGFRVYTRTLLSAVNWRATRDDFLFSFEIICQAIYHTMKIASVPVTARYQGKKRGASWTHSLRYTLGTVPVILRYFCACLGVPDQMFAPFTQSPPCPTCRTAALVEPRFANGEFTLFDCHICGNGFTGPVPRNMGTYYPSSYYRESGILGYFRELVFRLAQRRRVGWVSDFVAKSGYILDVGSGAGRLAADFEARGYTVTGIDPYYHGPSDAMKRVDFLRESNRKKYDALSFWESLEHVETPELYLKKAHALLLPGGYLFIEYPRFASFESRVFGKHWLHLDMPRHLTHFRDRGLADMVKGRGFRIVSRRGVYALEYAPMGMALSLMSVVGGRSSWRRALPLLIVTIPLSLVLYVLGGSPIGLLVARKDHTIHS